MSSTRFPYTTLFRSSGSLGSAGSAGATGGGSGSGSGGALGSTLGEPGKPNPIASGNPSVQDRKSTRLNSSHVAISYAVFCLKKKIILYTHFISYHAVFLFAYSLVHLAVLPVQLDSAR